MMFWTSIFWTNNFWTNNWNNWNIWFLIFFNYVLLLFYFRKVVDTFVQSGALRATLNHVHAIELNSIRPLLTHTLDQIGRLELSLAHVNRATQGSQSFLDRSNFNNSSYSWINDTIIKRNINTTLSRNLSCFFFNQYKVFFICRCSKNWQKKSAVNHL